MGSLLLAKNHHSRRPELAGPQAQGAEDLPGVGDSPRNDRVDSGRTESSWAKTPPSTLLS